MSEPLQSLMAELEQFGIANDSVMTERPRRMLNITRDTGEFLAVLVRATDEGPGIGNLKDIMAGQYKSKTGMGMGLPICRRIATAARRNSCLTPSGATPLRDSRPCLCGPRTTWHGRSGSKSWRRWLRCRRARSPASSSGRMEPPRIDG